MISEKNKDTFKNINAGLTDLAFVISCAGVVFCALYLMLEVYAFFFGSLPPVHDIIIILVLIGVLFTSLYFSVDYMNDIGKAVREEHGWRSKDE